jgi:hypothetical protein
VEFHGPALADSVDPPYPFPYTKEPTMTIEIRDASLEARIQKQLQATGSSSVEEVLLRLLDTQEEQDRWLSGNRPTLTELRDRLHRRKAVRTPVDTARLVREEREP